MNERIREIAQEAYDYSLLVDGTPYGEVYDKKFALLLLEDVMQTLFITGHESAVDELNKHFGVKE